MVGDRQGKCVNIGNCSLADKREPLITTAGQDFVCPECGKSLVTATSAVSGNSSRRNVIVLGGGFALLALVGGGLALRGRSDAKSAGKTEPTTPPPASPEPSVRAKTTTVVPPAEGGDCSETHQRVGVCAKTR